MKLFSDKKHIGYAIKNEPDNKEELLEALEKCGFTEYEFTEEGLVIKSNAFKGIIGKGDWAYFNEDLTDFIAIFPDLHFQSNFFEVEDAILID